MFRYSKIAIIIALFIVAPVLRADEDDGEPTSPSEPISSEPMADATFAPRFNPNPIGAPKAAPVTQPRRLTSDMILQLSIQDGNPKQASEQKTLAWRAQSVRRLDIGSAKPYNPPSTTVADSQVVAIPELNAENPGRRTKLRDSIVEVPSALINASRR